MTNSKTSARFTIDFLNKKIIGTKASFDKASKGISPIYEELTVKTKAHPNFVLEVKEPKHKSNKPKRDYNGMDFAFIEDYINLQSNAATIMREYQAVKVFAKEQKMSIYPFVKKWFLGEFDPDGEGFDMAKAQMEITNWKIAQAVLYADAIYPDENESKVSQVIRETNASQTANDNIASQVVNLEEKKGA